MKKVEITDDTGNKIKVDIKKFKEHLDEYHLNGSSVHEENGHYFTVDQKFRDKINSLYEQELFNFIHWYFDFWFSSPIPFSSF